MTFSSGMTTKHFLDEAFTFDGLYFPNERMYVKMFLEVRNIVFKKMKDAHSHITQSDGIGNFRRNIAFKT